MGDENQVGAAKQEGNLDERSLTFSKQSQRENQPLWKRRKGRRCSAKDRDYQGVGGGAFSKQKPRFSDRQSLSRRSILESARTSGNLRLRHAKD